MAGDWYVIQTGEDAGRLHLKGWFLTAIETANSWGDNPWVGIACCPRCGALVLNNGRNTISDFIWRHNAWHADTDHPIPAELRVESARMLGLLSAPVPSPTLD